MNTVIGKSLGDTGVRGQSRIAIKPYFQMMKPTISLMVVFTALPTIFMASDQLPSFGFVFSILVGTFLASSSSSIFNHLLDADIDGVMDRTRDRPIPSGHCSSEWAAFLGLLFGAASFLILVTLANPLTAWIALLANLFYVFIYTFWLKRRTSQNIVIGGAAGAVGPLIGWAAVSNTLSWEAWVLFLVIFLWTPPHFWALAIKYRDDYARAHVPMLPSLSLKGLESTRWQIFIYTLLLIPTTAVLYTHADAGLGYFLVSLVCSLFFSFLAFRLLSSKKPEHVMPVFFFSLLYIFAIFGALAIEQFVYLL